MGWNQGYTIMEEAVIAAYDTGALTKEFLNALMQPYAGSDIDHGGCHDLRSKDGLSADEIVCKVMEPERFAEVAPIPEQKPDRVRQTEKDFVITDNKAHDGYTYESWQEALRDERDSRIYDLWIEITRREWRFW